MAERPEVNWDELITYAEAKLGLHRGQATALQKSIAFFKKQKELGIEFPRCGEERKNEVDSEAIAHRRIIYTKVVELSVSLGNWTVPTENVIDLAEAIRLLMEQVFPMDTLVTLVHESEAPNAPSV